jgi:hypothetical protein
MTRQADALYRVHEKNVAWRAAGDEIVILDLATSVYYGLDPSGALLWHHLLRSATADDLVRALRAESPADPQRVAPDVDAFLAELLRYRLIYRS